MRCVEREGQGRSHRDQHPAPGHRWSGHLPCPQRRGPEKCLCTVWDMTASASPSLPDTSTHAHANTCAHTHLCVARSRMHTCLNACVCAGGCAHASLQSWRALQGVRGERQPGPPRAPGLCPHDAPGPSRGGGPWGPQPHSHAGSSLTHRSPSQRASQGATRATGHLKPDPNPSLPARQQRSPIQPFQKVLRSKFKGFDGGAA